MVDFPCDDKREGRKLGSFRYKGGFGYTNKEGRLHDSTDATWTELGPGAVNGKTNDMERNERDGDGDGDGDEVGDRTFALPGVPVPMPVPVPALVLVLWLCRLE